MDKVGKSIILIGLIVVIISAAIWLFGDKLRFLGRLPGDIRIEKENFKVYIPITTMLLVSVLLSAIMWIVQRMSK
ncbi:MAG: DUF2905 domain-containing protein [Sphingobacteriales bacterium]|nr:MAG: DUF2905 domain-containing protein [Sphingobacteriales bacterium]